MGDEKENDLAWENDQEVFSVVLSVILRRKCLLFFSPVTAYFEKIEPLIVANYLSLGWGLKTE